MGCYWQLAGHLRYGNIGKARTLFEKLEFKAVLQILRNRFHCADVFGQLQKVLFALLGRQVIGFVSEGLFVGGKQNGFDVGRHFVWQFALLQGCCPSRHLCVLLLFALNRCQGLL